MNGGDIFVLLLVGAGAVFAVRSLLKSRKSGGCGGSCAGCSGCGHPVFQEAETADTLPERQDEDPRA
jgi:hypothetical protein